MTQKFTEIQPKDGEIIAHCEHTDSNRKPFHFFHNEHGWKFTRPDKTKFETNWIILCNDCFVAYSGEPWKCVRSDSTWIGDEPEIKESIQ